MSIDMDRLCRTLVRDAADAIVYVGGDGKILLWNKGAERIFGFSEAEALDQSLDIIIPVNLRERHWTGFDQTMRTGKSRYAGDALLAVPALRKDGSRISVEFTVLPFHDEAGNMAGIAAILRDVTARFEEMKALRKKAAGK